MHEDVVGEEDIGVAVIDLGREHDVVPDEDLVAFVLDRCPVAALDALVAAGAKIPGDRPCAKVSLALSSSA